MKHFRTDRLSDNRGGVTRAAAILLVLIAVMLVLIAIPAFESFNYHNEVIACEQAMKSAKDGLIIEYMTRFEKSTVEDARKTLDEVMVARPDICPSRGNVYLVRGDNGIYEPFCGLHDPDEKHRCRLNASCALDLLRDELHKVRRLSETEPEKVEIQLNGKPLECVRVQDNLHFRWGTRHTNGYKGVVAFYGLVGDVNFDCGGTKAGDICYFVYADLEHCAIWRAKDGWTGDSYT